MADRRIKLVVEADSDGNFNGAARDLDDLGKSATKADGSVRELSKGHQALDKELDKVRTSIGDVRTEFQRTGDLGLLGDAKKLELQQKRLESFRSSLLNVGTEARNVGTELENAAAKFTGGGKGLELGSGFLGLGNALIPSAAALAVPLGAALSGAIQLAGAGGILAVGIASAFQNSQVKAAYTGLADDLKLELENATEGFDAPLINAAHTIGDAFKGIDLKGIFTGVQPDIDRLAKGIGGLITNLGPGLDRFAGNSQAIVGAFADELPRLGTAVSGFLDDLDQDRAAKGSLDALNVTFTLLNDSISGAGQALGTFATIFDLAGGSVLAKGLQIKQVGDFFKDFVKSAALGPVLGPLAPLLELITGKGDETKRSFQLLNQQLDQVGPSVRNAGLGVTLAAGDFSLLSSAISQTGQSTDVLAGQMADKLLNSMLGADQAALGFQQSLTQVGDALKSNKDSLDIHTAAGQTDRAAVLDAVGANIRQYDSLIQSGVGAQDAAAAYDENTAALEKQLSQAGLTRDQISSLIGKYRNVPSDVATDVELHGVAQALSDLDATLRAVYHLPPHRDIDIGVHTFYTYTGTPPGLAGPAVALHHQLHGGVVPAAHGLNSGLLPPRNPGTLVLAGEPGTKGEIFAPLSGISQSRAMQLGQTLGDAYDFSVTPNGYGNSASAPAGTGGSGGGVVNYYVTVAPTVGVTPAQQGAAVVSAIKAYEQNNGKGWRG